MYIVLQSRNPALIEPVTLRITLNLPIPNPLIVKDMTTYDPSLEFPDTDTETNDQVDLPISRHPFRLVIVHSPVVPQKRSIADVSAHSEVSIGRDIPSTPGAPRLRLKEMAVSKYHAVLYWDLGLKKWGLVDVGSVHGTFVHGDGTPAFERLSAAKSASHPRYLHDLDVIKIGGTTMVCHLHELDATGCGDCLLSTGNQLSLLHEPKQVQSTSSGAIVTPFHTPTEPLDAKRSIAKLKTQLLRHGYKHTDELETSVHTYIDRAASRRMHLGLSNPLENAPSSEITAPRASRPRVAYWRASKAIPIPAEQPPHEVAAPIPVSNIGHRLLSMQGWEPGTGLGLDKSGVREQPVPKPVSNRAGIGSETVEKTQR